MDCTEGAKTLTSCFVLTFVWYLDTEFPGEKVASIEFHQVTHLGDNYLKTLQTQCHIFDKEVFCKRCILCGDYQETQDIRKFSKHLKRERMSVIWTVIGRTCGEEAKLFQLISSTFIIGQTKRQFGTRLKDPQKAVLLCKKGNYALLENACQTNHPIECDNPKIINTNSRYLDGTINIFQTFVWKLGTSTLPTFLWTVIMADFTWHLFTLH